MDSIDKQIEDLNKQYGLSDTSVGGLESSMGVVTPPGQATPAVAKPVPPPEMQQPVAPPVVPTPHERLNKPQFTPGPSAIDRQIEDINRGVFFPPAPPAVHEPVVPPAPKLGGPVEAVTGLMKGLGASITKELPEMATEVYRAPGYMAGGVIQPTMRNVEEEKPQPTAVGEQFYQAGKMAVPSLLPTAIGAVGGGIIGGLIGNVPGAIAGAALGSKVMGQLGAVGFGMAEYSQAREEGYKKNQELMAQGLPSISEETINKQALERGATEWLGESLANVALGGLLSKGTTYGVRALEKMAILPAAKTVAGVLKPTFGKFLLSIPELIGTEVGTEIGQQWLEATSAKESGVRPEAQPWEEAKQVIIPTTIFSLLTGGLGAVAPHVFSNKVGAALNPNTDLTDPNVMKQRSAEAEDMLKFIKGTFGEQVAEAWRGVAVMNILQGQHIDMDQPMDVGSLQTSFAQHVDNLKNAQIQENIRQAQAKLGPGQTLNLGPEQWQGAVLPEAEQWRKRTDELQKPIEMGPKFALAEPGTPLINLKEEVQPTKSFEMRGIEVPDKFKGVLEPKMEQQKLDYHWIETKGVVPQFFEQVPLDLTQREKPEGGEGPEATPPEPPPRETPKGPTPPDLSEPPPAPVDVDVIPPEIPEVGKPGNVITPETPSTGATPETIPTEMHPMAKGIPGADTVDINNIDRFRHERTGLNGREQGIAMAINELDVATGQTLSDQELLDVWYGRNMAEIKQQPAPIANPFYSEVRMAAEELGGGITYDYEVKLSDDQAAIVLPRQERIVFENRLEAESQKHTGELGGKVSQVGTGKLGTSIYEIQRPYGKLIYNEATGELTAVQEDLTSNMIATQEVKLGVDQTLLLQTISKDIVNNDLAGTIANETIQNALDAGATRIDISTKLNMGSDGIAETVVIIKDNGVGMSTTQLKQNLMRLGAKGKEGTESRGGYGMAKAGFLLTPRRTVVTTVKNGVKTVLSGAKDQFFGVKGAGSPLLSIEKDVTEHSGTTFEMSFFNNSDDASKDNAYAISVFDVNSAFERYTKKGVFVHTVNFTHNGELVPSYGFDTLKQIFSSEKLSIGGSDLDVYFIPDDNPNRYEGWNEGFKVHVETFNKGLALFGMDPEYAYNTTGLRKVANWKAVVNFTKTPDVLSINYPFLRNRTTMNEEIRKGVEARINEKINEVNSEEYESSKKAFAAMIQNSPIINGTRVLIPFVDQAEFDAAKALVMNHQELISDMANLFQSFQVIVDKIGGGKLDLAITVDPKVHGFRSNPKVTGHEIFALNPFAITHALIMTDEWKSVVGATYPKLQAMSSNLTHTFVHELAHRRVSKHNEDFALEVARLYTQMTHAQLTRLENEGRLFYEKHGDALTELQNNFGNMGKGGSRFRQGNNALQATGGQLAGRAGGNQVLQEDSEERWYNGLGVASRLISKPKQMIGGETLDGKQILAPEQNRPNNPISIGGHTPSMLYREGEPGQGNVWVRQGKGNTNANSVLLVQISNELINPKETQTGIDRAYYDELYNNRRPGFKHPRDFWEIPQWISVAANSMPNTDVYVVRNIDEAIKFLSDAKYKTVAFSVLDVNKDMVKQIADGYKGRVAVGGYVDLRALFGASTNVAIYDNMADFVRNEGYKFNPGTNYRHFEGSEVIPRLVLSEGCLFNCKFCDVKPHGSLKETTPDNIRRQVESFKRLGARLVYLNDKTFGQASNYTMLAEIYDEMKAANPDFQGFIIQTTASQFVKLNDDFLGKSGIQYVELGVESYNNDILKNYSKPHTKQQIDQAMQRARENGLKVVPNIIIGMPEETVQTYQNTLNFLYQNRDIISHVNAYNLAVYKGTPLSEVIKSTSLTDADENKIEKSFHTNEDLHRDFSDAIFKFGLEQLQTPENQLVNVQTSPAPILPRFSERRGLVGQVSANKNVAWHAEDRGLYVGVVDGKDKYIIQRKGVTFEVSEWGADAKGRIGALKIGTSRTIEEGKLLAEGRFRMSERRLAGPEIQGKGIALQEVQQSLDNILIDIPKAALRGMAVENYDAIPGQIRRANVNLKPTDKAFFDRETRTLWIIAGNQTSHTDLNKSIAHELFGHFGIERVIGFKRLAPFYSKVFKLYGGEEGLSEIYTAYRLIPGSQDSKMIAAGEKIAQLAETRSDPMLWREFVTLVKDMVYKIFGVQMNLTETDIQVYLNRSRQLIADDRFKGEMQRYASLRQLAEASAWKTGLPTERFVMRTGATPDDTSAAHTVLNFGNLYTAMRNKNKNFAEQPMRDLKATEAMLSNPFWIGVEHPEFKRMFNVQLDRQDKRSSDTILLLKDPITNTGDNPFLKENLNRDALNKIIVWSDNQGIYLDTAERLQTKARELIGRNLTPDEVAGYNGWRNGFKKAIEFATRRLKEITFKINIKQPWFAEMNRVVQENIDPTTVIVSADAKVQKAFVSAVKYTQTKLADIAKLEQDLNSIEFYLPRERGRGEYVVRAFEMGPDGEKYNIDARRFENATQAEMGRMEMTRAYPDLTVEKTMERGVPEHIFGFLDIPVTEAFLQKAMERAQSGGYIDSEQADLLMKHVLGAVNDEIAARGFKQKYMHRRVGEAIKGYQTEHLEEVFVNYMKGLAGSMSKLEAAFDFHDALTDIHATGQQGLYEYATRYMRDMMRNPDSIDRKINALKTIPYTWYLAANLRMVPVQMTQNFVTAIPILSRLMKDNKVKGSGSAYIMKAMKDVVSGNYSASEKAMLQVAWEKGETMANYLNSIRGRISGSWAKNSFQKVLDIMSLPFAGMERFNRKVAYLAGYRMYTKAGMNADQAFLASREFVNMSHYAYGASNTPQLLRDGTAAGKVMGLGYVFQSFRHNYLLSLKYFMKSKEDRIALDMMMRSLAFIVLFGGLAAFPFLDDILEEAEKMFGVPYRSNMRKAMKKVGGEMLADVGMQGLPALIGFDLSGSIKIGIPIPGIGGPVQDSVFGVWGGLIDKGVQAVNSASNGDYARMVEAMAPVGAEAPLKAARLSKQGVRTASGKPILDEKGRPIVPTTTETVGQAIGFRPARMAEVSQERRSFSNMQEHYSKQKQDILKRLRTASTGSEFGTIRRDIQKYNLDVMKFKGLISPINMASMRQAMKPEESYMEYKQKGNF